MLNKTNKMSHKIIFRYTFLSLLMVSLLQSCVSKKEMLYLQDVESYNSEVTYNNQLLQVDDILKISVGALMPEAAIPYNNVTVVALLPTVLM